MINVLLLIQIFQRIFISSVGCHRSPFEGCNGRQPTLGIWHFPDTFMGEIAFLSYLMLIIKIKIKTTMTMKMMIINLTFFVKCQPPPQISLSRPLYSLFYTNGNIKVRFLTYWWPCPLPRTVSDHKVQKFKKIKLNW